MARLTTEESRNGHYLHLSIEQLFRLIRHGHHAKADLLSENRRRAIQRPSPNKPQSHGFTMRPLREALYSRLLAHFQFQNEKRLFSEVHHGTLFSVNV